MATKFLGVFILAAACLSTAQAADRSTCNAAITNSAKANSALCAGVPRRISQPAVVTEDQELLSYPSTSSSVVSSVGFIDEDEVGYFWSVSRGDRVTETFSSANGSITRAILQVDVPTNVLSGGASVNWNLLINDVVVDSFSVPEGFIGALTRDIAFAAIAGPNYTVSLQVTNEVPSGLGSHTLAYAGDLAHSVELFGNEADACDLDKDGDFDKDDLKFHFTSCRTEGGTVAACLSATVNFNTECRAK